MMLVHDANAWWLAIMMVRLQELAKMRSKALWFWEWDVS